VEALSANLNLISSVVVFGLLSGLLSTCAYIPYIIDTLYGRTQPQRSSWLIWSVLSSIAFFSQVYEGAGASLWFAGVQCASSIVIFTLSFRSGSGSFLKHPNPAILAAALAGLILWFFTENAAYALMITISISLLGGSVTVVKAFKDPDSETMTTWVACLLASVLALLSVGNLDLVLLAYPLYLVALSGSIVLALLLGKLVQREVDIRLNKEAVDIDL